jgi:acetylornithine deacetylase/succinyl-diaminopimelate desuccinylase-like protein
VGAHSQGLIVFIPARQRMTARFPTKLAIGTARGAYRRTFATKPVKTITSAIFTDARIYRGLASTVGT